MGYRKHKKKASVYLGSQKQRAGVQEFLKSEGESPKLPRKNLQNLCTN